MTAGAKTKLGAPFHPECPYVHVQPDTLGSPRKKNVKLIFTAAQQSTYPQGWVGWVGVGLTTDTNTHQRSSESCSYINNA